MKNSNFVFLILIVILTAPWFECTQKKISPVAINQRVDICAMCPMYVKNNSYAAELITTKGKVYKFEDIRCLYLLLSKTPSLKNEAKFIQDQNTKEWIQVVDAFFIYDKSVPTPMNFGVHAFKTKETAQKFLTTHPNAKSISEDEIKLLKFE